MKWEVETWRKLYVRVDAKWLSLPVSARGLGSELLKYADDEGRLHLDGDDPGLAVAYLLSAKPDEHKRIAKDFGLLVSVKHEFLVLAEPGVYQIRNFVSAQGKTSSAVRMARLRAKQNGRHSDANSDVTVTRTVTSHSDGPVREQSDVFRDETRRDETKPLPHASVTLCPDDEPEPGSPSWLRRAWSDAINAATRLTQPGYNWPEENQALADLWAEAQREGASGEDFRTVLAEDCADWVKELAPGRPRQGWRPSAFVLWRSRRQPVATSPRGAESPYGEPTDAELGLPS